MLIFHSFVIISFNDASSSSLCFARAWRPRLLVLVDRDPLVPPDAGLLVPDDPNLLASKGLGLFARYFDRYFESTLFSKIL